MIKLLITWDQGFSPDACYMHSLISLFLHYLDHPEMGQLAKETLIANTRKLYSVHENHENEW